MHDIAALHDHLKRRIARDGRRQAVESIAPDPLRRARSLRHCHLPTEQKGLLAWRADNGRFTPQLAAAIDDDPNLSDGARRCARKIAEYTYRRNRDTRECQITVTYLARALRRCGRTIQRYLRQLEHAGYIRVHVIAARTRMCVGLAIQLLTRILPRHHAQKWPLCAMNSVATPLSQNHSDRYKTRKISRAIWAWQCCEGVHRAYMKTIQPPAALH